MWSTLTKKFIFHFASNQTELLYLENYKVLVYKFHLLRGRSLYNYSIIDSPSATYFVVRPNENKSSEVHQSRCTYRCIYSIELTRRFSFYKRLYQY